VRLIFSRALAIAALVACFSSAEAQTPAYSILRIELVNATLYTSGYCGVSDQYRNPNKLATPAVGGGAGVADIVSVNGQPVKGTAIETIGTVLTSPNLTSGRFIADISNAFPAQWELVILNLDGTLIGSIHIAGIGGGPAPVGAPKEITGSGWTVTGGTGAFFGARGYFQPVQDPVSGERRTTDCEDPAYRRINADAGGNKRHPILYLVPLTQPQILTTPNGPAVIHASDGTLVSTAKPASAGEILSLFASGLGPTRPGVDPGQAFPASPLQVVNSPVQVLVNGNASDALYAGGYPGAVDGYQVNFRIPDGAAGGMAALHLTSAWIAGSDVKIPIL
jgi:hypothetical protein